jgi:hypothetical protein
VSVFGAAIGPSVVRVSLVVLPLLLPAIASQS